MKELETFNDPALQEAYKDIVESGDAYIDYLDSVSEDIKKLEKILKHYACQSFVLNSSSDELGFLSWCNDRIMFVCDKEKTTKPLIECKGRVRLRMSRYLPLLLRECMRAVNRGDTIV